MEGLRSYVLHYLPQTFSYCSFSYFLLLESIASLSDFPVISLKLSCHFFLSHFDIVLCTGIVRLENRLSRWAHCQENRIYRLSSFTDMLEPKDKSTMYVFRWLPRFLCIDLLHVVSEMVSVCNTFQGHERMRKYRFDCQDVHHSGWPSSLKIIHPVIYATRVACFSMHRVEI